MYSARKGRRARRCFDSSAWNHLQHEEKDFLDCEFSRRSRIVKTSSSESDSNGFGFFCFFIVVEFFCVCGG